MQDCDKVESNSNLSGGVCCNSGDRIPAVMLLRDRVYVFSQLGGNGNKRMGNRLYTRGKPCHLAIALFVTLCKRNIFGCDSSPRSPNVSLCVCLSVTLATTVLDF